VHSKENIIEFIVAIIYRKIFPSIPNILKCGRFIYISLYTPLPQSLLYPSPPNSQIEPKGGGFWRAKPII